jgi:hypothetical protein
VEFGAKPQTPKTKTLRVLVPLALLNAQSALSLGVLLRKTPGAFPSLRGFDFAEFCFAKFQEIFLPSAVFDSQKPDAAAVNRSYAEL